MDLADEQNFYIKEAVTKLQAARDLINEADELLVDWGGRKPSNSLFTCILKIEEELRGIAQ